MHDFSPFYSPYGPGLILGTLIPIIAVVAIWSVIIKGYALWTAARAGQRGWFIAILVVNTVGIFELIYLIKFSPKGSNKFNSPAPQTPVDSSSPHA